MAQVSADLGSTFIEAGTHHRYPPYLSSNLVLKILIRVREYKQNVIRKINQKKAHSEPDYLHTYKGHSSIATISIIIGIYTKITNIYHRYPNNIFIMSPIIQY